MTCTESLFQGERIKKSAGFTFIALMIVMTTIGFHAYQTYIAKTHMDVPLASFWTGETTAEALIQKHLHTALIDAPHPGLHTTDHGSYVPTHFDNASADAIICTRSANHFIDNLKLALNRADGNWNAGKHLRSTCPPQ